MAPTSPDIFLSYSRQDLSVAGQMAAALQAAGHTVWWDQALKAGEVYDKVTETALLEAQVVVVLWSKASVASDWVRSEATVALQRNAMLPVMIEDCRRPVMFELRQSADLVGWKGNAKDPRLLAFVADVTRQLGSAAAPMPAPISVATPNRRLLLGGGLALAGLAGAGLVGWRQLGGKPDDGTPTSIAVLPFANLSGDPAQAYFSDGISEELRSSLSRIAGLQVAARTSSEVMRDADVKEAAAKLGVTHVLTGSVRRGGGTIRVSTQLLNGKTGLETWSQVYDRPEGDALVVQTNIAISVANALSFSLGKGAAVLGATTTDPAAFDAFLRASAITIRDEAGFRARVAAFDKAIAIDPDFAAAYAGRSSSLTDLFWEVGGVDLLEEAGRDVARAVKLAPTLPIVQSALGYHQISKLDFRGAAQSYDRLLLLQNSETLQSALSAPALFLVNIGRTQEGLILMEKSVALDPLNPLVRINLASALNAARQGAAALAASQAINADFPDQKPYNSALGRSLLLLNRPAEALAAFAPVKNPRFRAWGQAIAQAMLGDRAGSDRALAVLKADYADIGAYQISCVHAARGEIDLALAALDRTIAMKSRGLTQLRSDFSLDPLRSDPRFIAIEKQLGFPPR